MESTTQKYRYPALRKWVNSNYNYAFYFEKHYFRTRLCKSFVLAALDVTNRCIQTLISKTKDGFLNNERGGKQYKHVTVPNAIKIGFHISTSQ
jgi:hypothetical protein